MKKLLTAACLIFITSCSSNSFTYLKNPTPITKNQTKYHITDVDVKFVQGKAKRLDGTNNTNILNRTAKPKEIVK